MKAQPDFWHNFPLFLPDHASYGQGSFNEQRPVIQEQQPPLHQLYMPEQQETLSQQILNHNPQFERQLVQQDAAE